MARKRARRQPAEQPEEELPPQRFDTSLKEWMNKQAPSLLSHFFKGAIYLDTRDVEVVRPTMRADKVFLMYYEGVRCVGHIEFETGADDKMAYRLAVYNTVLLHDYELPVVSMIVYPFRCKMAESPLETRCGEKDLITFHFLRFALFEEDADYYVREHVTAMYPVLPTMQGANHTLLKQAMEELAELYRDSTVTLSQQFVWMQLMLERTDTIPPDEKQEVYDQLKTYDPLWENHPKVKKIRAESEAKGRAEGEARGRAEGELQASRKMVVSVVAARFPSLAELARKRVAQINNIGVLDMLIQQVSTAPDENTLRWLLQPSVA